MIRLCKDCVSKGFPLTSGFIFSSQAECDRCSMSKVHDIADYRAKKADNGKPKLSLITKESLEAEARALDYGAKKYDKNNYKKGMEWSRIIDAALRHITAFNSKENTDKESGLSHLDHAKACIAMLVYYYENKIGTDDR